MVPEEHRIVGDDRPLNQFDWQELKADYDKVFRWYKSLYTGKLDPMFKPKDIGESEEEAPSKWRKRTNDFRRR